MKIENEPLVSVILPFYNEENFLAETIESVIQQEYLNWELILIDDNGSSLCSTIAKGYTNDLPNKIFYSDHEGHLNKGPAASRNLGIARAKGDLIAFIDADDFWLPNKIKEQVEIFQKYGEVAMLIEASKYLYSWEDNTQRDKIVSIGVTPNKVYLPPSLVTQLYPLGKGAAPCPSSIMITKTALINNNGFEESFIDYRQAYEDQAFFSKIYLHEIIYVAGSCNNLYRQRKGSSMHNLLIDKQSYFRARYYYLQWLKNYLKEKKIQSWKVNKLILKAIFEIKRPFLYRIIIFFCRKVIFFSRK
jgi:glycosyltransferase involved in cell wall biosynthesis